MLRCVLCVIFLATTGLAQEAARMDQVVQSYVSNKQFMGSVLVARGDQVVFSRGYGWANLEWDIPNTPTTKFRIGSITKQFTAAAILLLEEQGRLNIEDPIRKYLPDEPSAWDRITIRHLLTHTSGIRNLLTLPEVQKMVPFPQTPDQLMALVREKPLEFAPGEKYQYSNSGYNLLGCLIEKVSGQRYQDFIRKNIFTVLGMKDSGYDTNSEILPRRASGYAPGGPVGIVNAEYVHMSNTYSAGGLYSTIEDLLRWEQGLFGGKLLTPRSLTKITTPFLGGYAFGLGVETVKGRVRVGHDGGVPGFNAFLAYYPDSKVTIAVLANLWGPEIPSQIAGLLAAVAHGENVILTSELEAITLPSDTLQKFVGSYQLTPGNNIRISLEGGHLVSRMGGLMGFVNSWNLSASSETCFFSKAADVQLEFATDNEGTAANLILRRHGDEMKAPRVRASLADPKEKPVHAGILARYTGVYRLPPGFELVITVEGHRLVLNRTWQFLRYPLFAESETQFLLKELETAVEFKADDRGVVSQLVLRSGSSEINAPRVVETGRIDGAWTGTVPGPDGSPMPVMYIFRAEGNMLAGSVSSRLGDGGFTGGKVEGDKISFAVNAGQWTIKTAGTISGDLMDMVQTNGTEVAKFTVKRVRAQRVATN